LFSAEINKIQHLDIRDFRWTLETKIDLLTARPVQGTNIFSYFFKYTILVPFEGLRTVNVILAKGCGQGRIRRRELSLNNGTSEMDEKESVEHYMDNFFERNKSYSKSGVAPKVTVKNWTSLMCG